LIEQDLAASPAPAQHPSSAVADRGHGRQGSCLRRGGDSEDHQFGAGTAGKVETVHSCVDLTLLSIAATATVYITFPLNDWACSFAFQYAKFRRGKTWLLLVCIIEFLVLPGPALATRTIDGRR
jgi:hypothetical protein